MKHDDRFRRFAGWTAVFSAPLAYSTIVLSFAGVGGDVTSFDTAVYQNAAAILPLLSQKPYLSLWSSLLDFFGFYLLLIPLAVYLWYWLHPQKPEWTTFFSICGLGYLLFGAMGAAVLAVIFPSQAVLYGQTSGAEQQMAVAIFTVVGDAVQRAIWGLLDPLLGGIWWLGIGWLLLPELSRRGKRPFLAWLSLILGIVNLLSGLGEMLSIPFLVSTGLGLYFFLAPMWAAWMGI
ncbi:MAG: DUF4386 family protein, partial [Anaerolineales bacterium]|nr:DUF4386 family protein [Anaerolineales bacterium]